jgi:hypothetical protein
MKDGRLTWPLVACQEVDALVSDAFSIGRDHDGVWDTGSVRLSLAPRFSEVIAIAAETLSRFNGFLKETVIRLKRRVTTSLKWGC